MGVNVRQRQYAIGLRGSSSSQLTTENFWTCYGFLGIDKRNGIVFLCHLDTFWCAFALPKLVAELSKHAANDLSGFQLYTMTGLRPVGTFGLSLLAGLVAAGLFGWWAAFVGFLGTLLWLCGARLLLKFQLWRLNAFSAKPMFLGYSSKYRGFGKCGIHVDADNKQTPTPYSYGPSRDYESFKEPKTFDFNMTKAEGSV